MNLLGFILYSIGFWGIVATTIILIIVLIIKIYERMVDK